MIEVQARLKIVARQKLARDAPKGNSERVEVRFLYGQPGGHLVTAKFFEMRSTTLERLHERQPFDASPAPLPQSRGIERDQDRRPVILSCQPRRHDAEH